MDVRSFNTDDVSTGLLAEIRVLLDEAFDGDFDDTDWLHALGGVHVVAFENDEVRAHGSVVERLLEVGATPVRTGYVEAVATRPSEQGRGWGTAVMAEIGTIVRSRFDMGALATGEHAFYERLGWLRWRGPTAVRRHGALVRTPEDDDAVMVLPVAGAASIELTATIACNDRHGDVW
jgi:aminoglycoside 2'-N-acetyltransferase I